MENIYNLTLQELEELIVNNGYKKYNASQIYDWLYKKRCSSFDDMTNIKKELIAFLKENYEISLLKILKKEEDKDVKKYLFELKDGNKIEAVVMFHDYGNSICISTQIGCNMGCAFCESGRLKKVRNLERHEMVNQILTVENDLNIRLTHLVLMGIGEPFDNFDNVMKFIEIINNDKGISLGSRHITISTCGIVPKIIDFMNINKQVNLAISLHAPNNELRNKIMPINKAYNLEALMDAIRKYIDATNRRVTFEYILLKDINDSKECAIELSKLLRGLNCHVNLIPYNETENGFKRSDKVMEFYDTLKRHKIGVTVRKEFGSKVSAACGQLRSNYKE